MTLKALRFFSGIGYENSVHAHAWDFVDPALVQQTFLGSNLAVDGIQASWIAPLPLYLELGAELGNAVEFPFDGHLQQERLLDRDAVRADRRGHRHEPQLPGSGAWLLNSQNLVDGASTLDLDQRTGVSNTLSGGNTNIWGLDFVYKWSPDGNPTERNFKLVAEWMQRELTGDLTFDNGGPAAATPVSSARSRAAGIVQGIYQFAPRPGAPGCATAS